MRDYSDKLGNAGCNDYYLPATKENIELYEASTEGELPIIHEGNICTFDFMILDELRNRLADHFGIEAEEA